jgi:hypothetical protein
MQETHKGGDVFLSIQWLGVTLVAHPLVCHVGLEEA